MTQLDDDKRALRAALKHALAALPVEHFRDAGRAIAAHLAPSLPGSGVVAAFAARAREVDTGPLLGLLRERGVRVALPRIDGDELAFCLVDDVTTLPADRLGIPTPPSDAERVPLAACALVVVPGLGVDARGHRIGFGRGFYDRALARAAVVDGAVVDRAVGVFVDGAVVPHVPHGAHDVRLRRFCTPLRGLVDVDKLPSTR
jgi:5-formyltetrahydrofolate cyclo-ligase